MQQSCFIYNEKGPFYIQEEETKEEKEVYKKDLEARNALRYKEDKVNQEIKNRMRRLRATTIKLRRKPQFKHDENTRVYILKEGKGGINQY